MKIFFQDVPSIRMSTGWHSFPYFLQIIELLGVSQVQLKIGRIMIWMTKCSFVSVYVHSSHPKDRQGASDIHAFSLKAQRWKDKRSCWMFGWTEPRRRRPDFCGLDLMISVWCIHAERFVLSKSEEWTLGRIVACLWHPVKPSYVIVASGGGILSCYYLCVLF